MAIKKVMQLKIFKEMQVKHPSDAGKVQEHYPCVLGQQNEVQVTAKNRKFLFRLSALCKIRQLLLSVNI
jgi:hypothetical protein